MISTTWAVPAFSKTLEGNTYTVVPSLAQTNPKYAVAVFYNRISILNSQITSKIRFLIFSFDSCVLCHP